MKERRSDVLPFARIAQCLVLLDRSPDSSAAERVSGLRPYGRQNNRGAVRAEIKSWLPPDVYSASVVLFTRRELGRSFFGILPHHDCCDGPVRISLGLRNNLKCLGQLRDGEESDANCPNEAAALGALQGVIRIGNAELNA